MKKCRFYALSFSSPIPSLTDLFTFYLIPLSVCFWKCQQFSSWAFLSVEVEEPTVLEIDFHWFPWWKKGFLKLKAVIIWNLGEKLITGFFKTIHKRNDLQDQKTTRPEKWLQVFFFCFQIRCLLYLKNSCLLSYTF